MAIFSVAKGQLQVLMIQRSNFPEKGKWALPGGFVDLKTDPDLMATAHRKLLEKTGIHSLILNKSKPSAINIVIHVVGQLHHFILH
jgi:ADP-ribose pyrophosphatase YjhB (NUDIX family)